MKLQIFLRYPLKTPKYTTSDPYCMQNNLLFGIPFSLNKNLKVIIQIFSTIYLSLAVFFPSTPLLWNRDLGSTNLEKFHDKEKIWSTTNSRFSTTIIPLRTILKLIKLYIYGLKVFYSLISAWKGNLIHEYNIFVAPKCGCLKRYISANNTFC